MLFLLSGCLINTELYERRMSELADIDGDGVASMDDCDDQDPNRFPRADDVPYDGIDQDCDGADLDDLDGDGSPRAEDCDDNDTTVNPRAAEVAYDGIDQDCDGVDSDDLDADGYALADDCDDENAGVHPGAAETWANGFQDDDCDGVLEQAEPTLFGDNLWYSSVEDASLGNRLAPYTDLDGDGLPEVLASAVTTTRQYLNSGAVYLLSAGLPGDVDESALRTIDAGEPGWYLGAALHTHDLDGDGIPEVLTSAPGKDTTGEGFLIDGSSLSRGDVSLPGDAAHVFEGSEPDTYWGTDIEFLGDIDGDGIDEVAMSASYASVDGMESAGRVAVFSLANSLHTTASPDFTWNGYYSGGRFGESVFPVGDVDGDGLPDVLITAEEGDIFAVLPAVSGSILDVALSRVTRDGDDSRYRTAPVGDLNGDEDPDVLLLGAERALAFTGLGTFTLRTQADAWLTVIAESGSQFADAVDLGDKTGDGLSETLLTRTWSPSDGTAWIGVLISEDLSWQTEVDADALDISALSTRPNASLGYRGTTVGTDPGILFLGGTTDDRGASGGGSVAVLSMPE